MSYTPSNLRYESYEQQRRGHHSNKSLPDASHHHTSRPIRNSDTNAGITLGSLVPNASLHTARRSEDDLDAFIRPFPKSSSTSSSSSSNSMTARDSRSSSNSSITHEILPLHIQGLSHQTNTNKPLPSPLNNKPLPRPILLKPAWTIPVDFDPRDYSIEPMSYWSDDTDDSDSEDAKKKKTQHKRGSSKLTGMWRGSRNSKSIKATTSPTNPHFLDEVTNNLARLQ